MIVYGWKPAHLKTSQFNSVTCPNCGEKGNVISIYSNHAHIFWIPLFPLGKKGVSQCQHCAYSVESKNMSDELKREYADLKSEVRTPLWQFIGVIIIAVLIGVSSYMSKVEAEKELEYISNPIVGDIYEYKTESNNFSTLKITEVLEDSIIYQPNNYEISTKTDIGDIDIKSNYSEDLYIISREELKNMYEEKIIYDINRD